MNTRLQFGILALVAIAGWAASWVIAQEELSEQDSGRPAADEKTTPPVDVRQYSYAIGQDIGTSFRAENIPLDLESLLAGARDAQQNAKPRYDQQACILAMQKLNQQRMNRAIEMNKQFLEENKKVEGVKVTASGLQYKVLKSGKGASPTASDVVRTHYRGTLVDGTEFDSSYARGEPATFPVGGVIAGWTEALQKMKVGDKWQLVIPSELGYEDRGAGDVIPPHSTLIFEIELLGIEGK